MKRMIICTSAGIAVLAVASLLSTRPAQGDDDNGASEVLRGLAIAPVPLNLQGKDRELVGLGSYIVNAQAACNDCHTCPSFAPGHNPYPPPVGVSGDGQINSVNYLAGGVNFGVAISRNLTPDSNGKPEGLTLKQFISVFRTGHDPIENETLTIMPWPVYRYMTTRDLVAIYTYLTAIPPASPGSCTGPGE
jgi:hypothetical protein